MRYLVMLILLALLSGCAHHEGIERTFDAASLARTILYNMDNL